MSDPNINVDEKKHIEELKRMLLEGLKNRSWNQLEEDEKEKLATIIDELVRLGVKPGEIGKLINAAPTTVSFIRKHYVGTRRTEEVVKHIEKLKEMLKVGLRGRSWKELSKAEKKRLQPLIEELHRLGVKVDEISEVVGAHPTTIHGILKRGIKPPEPLEEKILRKEIASGEQAALKITTAEIVKETTAEVEENIELGKWVKQNFGAVAESYGLDLKEFLEKVVEEWETWHDKIDEMKKTIEGIKPLIEGYQEALRKARNIIETISHPAYLYAKQIEVVGDIIKFLAVLRGKGMDIPRSTIDYLLMYMRNLVSKGGRDLRNMYSDYVEKLEYELSLGEKYE